jgi:hypothetical protein
MVTCHRQDCGEPVALCDVVIGVTQARCHHVDHDLDFNRPVQIDVGDLVVAWDTAQNRAPSGRVRPQR